jgi:dTDP-glucose pyrophosphorylase
MLNIVIPMAGRGSRFSDSGYVDPKPLIPVGGRPMIEWVIDNVRPSQPHRFIFICLAEHLCAYPQVDATLRGLCPGCELITVDRVTEGAACTVLLARDLIDNDDPLMIANADQLVAIGIDAYLAEMALQQADGMIMTFWSDHPKWSYCRLRPDGTVGDVVEKQVVSSSATVGIYNFRRGADFAHAADAMIRQNLRVNNEFYVAPTYNQLIAAGQRVVVAETGHEYDGMFGLGVPVDLDFFKTTNAYMSGWKSGGELRPTDDELLSRRTELYASFLLSRNRAGLRALLHENAQFHDADDHVSGRSNVIVRLVRLLAPTTMPLGIKVTAVKGTRTTLVFGTGGISAILELEWSDRRIGTVTSRPLETQ